MTLYKHIDRDCLKGEGQYLAGYFQLVSSPVLQPVTPEAMAKLESRNATGVLIMSRDWLYHCSHTSDRGWIRHDDYANASIPRPARGWFIVRAELPEVT